MSRRTLPGSITTGTSQMMVCTYPPYEVVLSSVVVVFACYSWSFSWFKVSHISEITFISPLRLFQLPFADRPGQRPLDPDLKVLSFNPSNPKIKIWILICCPYLFPTEVVGRGWLNIKQIHLLRSCLYFSWPLCFTKHWHYKEKFDADHSWVLMS